MPETRTIGGLQVDDGVQRTCVFKGLPTQTIPTAIIEPKRFFPPRCKQSPQANIAPGAAERWSLFAPLGGGQESQRRAINCPLTPGRSALKCASAGFAVKWR
jgi:hypothetical protein